MPRKKPPRIKSNSESAVLIQKPGTEAAKADHECNSCSKSVRVVAQRNPEKRPEYDRNGRNKGDLAVCQGDVLLNVGH